MTRVSFVVLRAAASRIEPIHQTGKLAMCGPGHKPFYFNGLSGPLPPYPDALPNQHERQEAAKDRLAESLVALSKPQPMLGSILCVRRPAAVAATNTAYRSAVHGQFVTKKYAETHPNTTVKEKVPAPQPKGMGR